MPALRNRLRRALGALSSRPPCCKSATAFARCRRAATGSLYRLHRHDLHPGDGTGGRPPIDALLHRSTDCPLSGGAPKWPLLADFTHSGSRL